MSSFRIRSNTVSQTSHRYLTDTNRHFSKSMARMSSGQRIVSASDDASGLAIANRLRSDYRAFTIASRNIAEANSVLQIAEGATQNIESILVRLKELAVQSASSNADGTRDALQAEVDAQVEEVARIAQATQYQGVELVTGGWDATFQIGPRNEASSQLELDLTAVDLTDLGLGIDGLDVSTQADAQDALDILDAAIGVANGALGALGAIQNRLVMAEENVNVTRMNYMASESVIRDADLAEESTNLARHSVLQQVSAAMLAQANAAPQIVLTLIQ